MSHAAALYLDENVSAQVAARLNASGFDVLTTRDAGMLGRADEEQLRFAADHARILVSHDVQDFRTLAIEWARDGKSHNGIVCLPYEKPATLCAWIQLLFELYPSPDDLRDCTMVLPVQGGF